MRLYNNNNNTLWIGEDVGISRREYVVVGYYSARDLSTYLEYEWLDDDSVWDEMRDAEPLIKLVVSLMRRSSLVVSGLSSSWCGQGVYPSTFIYYRYERTNWVSEPFFCGIL
jgi:hypothetical protein